LDYGIVWPEERQVEKQMSFAKPTSIKVDPVISYSIVFRVDAVPPGFSYFIGEAGVVGQ